MKTEVKVILGVVAGAMAGLLTGILIAPDSGKKTRKQLYRKASDTTQDALEALEESYHKAKVAGNEKLHEWMEGAKKVTDNAKKTLETATAKN